MPANLENSAVATALVKVEFHSNPIKGQCKRMFKLLNICAHFTWVKLYSNYPTIALISHTSKIMLKILQARLQHYVNCKLPGVQAGFRKGRGTTDQITNIRWIIEKTKEFQKKKFCFIDYKKAFDYVDHNKLQKILKRDGSTRPPYLFPEKPVCKPRSNS